MSNQNNTVNSRNRGVSEDTQAEGSKSNLLIIILGICFLLFCVKSCTDVFKDEPNIFVERVPIESNIKIVTVTPIGYEYYNVLQNQGNVFFDTGGNEINIQVFRRSTQSWTESKKWISGIGKPFPFPFSDITQYKMKSVKNETVVTLKQIK